MGTMEVISLDDTVENDSSLFIIDETPMPIAPEDGTNKENLQKKKRKLNNKNTPQKKKRNADLSSVPRAKWLLFESCSGGPSQEGGGSTSCSNTATDSITTNSLASSSSSKSNMSDKKAKRKKKKKSVAETIVILSDNEDDDKVELVDVIDISDDEVGVIGGQVSKPVRFIPKPPYNTNRAPIFHMNLNKNQNGQRSSPGKKKGNCTRRLRPIVIDGSNVAFGHGGHGKGVFSTKGIEICCNYFLERGHTVKVFIPQFRRRHPATTDTHLLDKLEKDNILIFTPSRNVNGRKVVSYDDRYIVEYATKCGGIIISRDNFNDLISENHEWKETIHQRLLMFTWVDDLLMFPHDPLGRDGPPLDEFLSFPPEGTSPSKKRRAEVTFIK